MWKAPVLALLALSYGVCAAAADLTIGAGQTYTISADQSDLRLERLTIGDNAHVRFAPGVNRWRVEAQHVDMGSNVTIDGRGIDAAAAAAGSDFGDRAKDCEPGAAGRAGGAGATGGNGVNLVFWWGVDAWGSAKFLTDGGNGGSGGNGGRGQDGGRVNRCSGPAAGDGGSGGDGGDGGNAGDVVLHYFSTTKQKSALTDHLSISASGGEPGAAGKGGKGGAGAEGRFQRTATSEAWFAAGKAGKAGTEGRTGANGSAGAVTVSAVASDSAPSWASEAGSLAPADRGTVQSLQKQVQALQAGSAPSTTTDEIRDLRERVKNLESRVKALESR